jgi:hypothetical protein
MKSRKGRRGISILCLASALDVGEWPTPHPGPFTLGKTPATYFTGVWVGPRSRLDGWRKSRTPTDSIQDRPARNQSLYRLRCPGPHKTTGEFKYLHITITRIYICPDWLWGPVSLLFNGYWRSFRGVRRQRLKSTTHSHLIRSLRMKGAKVLLPLLTFMVCTAITLPFFDFFIYTKRLIISVWIRRRTIVSNAEAKSWGL